MSGSVLSCRRRARGAVAAPAPDSPPRAGDDGWRSLMQRVRMADEIAFAEVYDRTSPAVVAIARCAASDEQAAFDAARVAYLALWRTSVNGGVIDDPLRWLVTRARVAALSLGDPTAGGQYHLTHG